jgi:outer membrane protein assembly factor BamB
MAAVPKFLALSLILSLNPGLAPLARAGDQPQWGEAWSRNMVSGETNLPDSFDPATGRNVKWSALLGSETHGTPVIARGRVYLGTNNEHPRNPAEEGDRGVLMCFDEATGRFLWQLTVPKRTEDIYFDWPHSGICSPVTVDGDRVYVVNNRGVVMCLGQGKPKGITAAGELPKAPPYRLWPADCDVAVIWQFDLTDAAGIWSHDAAHSSILVDGDYLYLNTGTGVDNTHKRIRTPDAPSLVVLDKRTGRLVARDGLAIAPNIFHSTWSAPSLATVHGRPLVFFAAGNGIVYAFEPVGKRGGLMDGGSVDKWIRGSPAVPASAPASATLASVPPSNHQTIKPSIPASAAPAPSLPLVWQFDFDPEAPKTNVHRYNSNRRESPSNFYGMPVCRDNRLYVAGGGDIWWGKNQAWLKCLDATRTGDITTNGLVWSYTLNKHVLGTPAVDRGLVFIADTGGILHCVDAATGLACWTHELTGEAWASPLVADGKVYLGTRRGVCYVLAAARDKRVLDTIDLGAPISSTAVAANGVLYVTTMSRLYACARP